MSLQSSLTSANSNSASQTIVTGPTTYTLNSGYNYKTIFSTDSLDDMSDPALKTILSCVPESQIEELVNTVKTNLSNEDCFKYIIRTIVKLRHYTEDFLLKYIDYLDRDTIYSKHRENILSLEYHNIALILLEREKD